MKRAGAIVAVAEAEVAVAIEAARYWAFGRIGCTPSRHTHASRTRRAETRRHGGQGKQSHHRHHHQVLHHRSICSGSSSSHGPGQGAHLEHRPPRGSTCQQSQCQHALSRTCQTCWRKPAPQCQSRSSSSKLQCRGQHQSQIRS